MLTKTKPVTVDFFYSITTKEITHSLCANINNFIINSPPKFKV